MNYRERLREDIKCPQFGDITYGRLGSLKYEDRKSIKRLLDEMDRADEVIKKQYFELDKYKIVLDKIKEKDVMYYDPEYSKIYGELCSMPGANNTRTPVIVIDDELLELLEEIE